MKNYVSGYRAALSGSENIEVSVDGKLFLDGVSIPVPEEGIRLTVRNINKVWRIEDLMLLAFKPPIALHDSLITKIKAVVVNPHLPKTVNNLIWKFPVKLGSVEFPGWYHIPGSSRTYINDAHEFAKSTDQKTLIPIVVGGNLYRTVSILPDVYGDLVNVSKTVTSHRHRLLVLVFTDYADNVTKLVTDHKNGIKGDDRLENLELITYSENLRRSYALGSHSSVRFTVYNVITDDIRWFESIREASISLNVSEKNLTYRIGAEGIYDNGYQYLRGIKTIEECKTLITREYLISKRWYADLLVVHDDIVVFRGTAEAIASRLTKKIITIQRAVRLNVLVESKYKLYYNFEYTHTKEVPSISNDGLKIS